MSTILTFYEVEMGFLEKSGLLSTFSCVNKYL